MSKLIFWHLILVLILYIFLNYSVKCSPKSHRHHKNKHNHPHHKHHHHHKHFSKPEVVFDENEYSLENQPYSDIYEFPNTKEKTPIQNEFASQGRKIGKSGNPGKLSSRSGKLGNGLEDGEIPFPSLPPIPADVETREIQVAIRRPESPAVAFLIAPAYDNTPLDASRYKKTPYEYCKGNSFISGFQVMADPESLGLGTTELNRIAFICEEFSGVHINNIYLGSGSGGEYQKRELCGSISTTASVSYGPLVYSNIDKKICATGGLKGIYMNCTNRIAKYISYEPKYFNDKNKATKLVLSTCPQGSALCGFRILGNTKTEHSNYCVKNNPGGCCGPQIVSIDFACCKLQHAAAGCDAAYNWQTVATCRKGLKCKLTYTSGMTTSKYHDNATVRQSDQLVEVGMTIGASASIVKGEVSGAIGTRFFDGTTVTDIIEQTSTTEQVSEIDMSDCDGSVQQLAFSCGVYEINSKHFRCQRLDPTEEFK